jgi:Flp pilus assembly protein TadD
MALFRTLNRLVLSSAFLALIAGVAWGGEEGNCADWLATLVSIEGRVERNRAAGESWSEAKPETPFCLGDRVRTGARSRALLHLRNETFVRLDQNTTLVFAEARDKVDPSLVELLRGIAYFISRVPYELKIKTRFVNAVIKGTEFAVGATDAESRIDVFEGRVAAENAHGEIALERGQSAVASAGQPPRLRLDLQPEDAVRWTLHYPAVAALPAAASPEIAQALALYRAGQAAAALDALAAVPAGGRGAALADLEANLLLSVGRQEEAEAKLREVLRLRPEDADALSMLAVVELAQNRKDEALRLAERARAAHPDAPSAYRALSYARQARFDLKGALQAAREAAELRPDEADGWARVAELELALGERARAQESSERAVALRPGDALALTVQGFALLARESGAEAARLFREAAALDSGAPLPRFGLGLALIQSGDLDGGTENLSIAAALDPRDALIRSYLGKAYHEQKRERFAETQFALARRFDPKDPTPHFYDAIKKQTENRPVEAMEDLQKAIELNDNRAIYRSRQALDSDLAARSAAVGRIYNDLGFGQRALVEGWRSVNADPGDYSAHRFLADSYANLSGHQAARVSELLQSQLLQPLNVTPVQPHLAESNLIAFYGLGPSALSFNEFNPLFNRDRLALQASGLLGTRGTGADELVQSGVWRNLSYSLGQFHFETDGYRPKNGQRRDIYNAFVQAALAPNLSVQMEARYNDYRYEDVVMRFDSLPRLNSDANKTETTTLRLGAHYMPTPASDFVASLIYQKRRNEQFGFRQDSEGYILEGQYQYRWERLKTVFGMGYYDVNDRDAQHIFWPVATTTHGNGYWYNYLTFPRRVTWTLGLSVDSMHNGLFARDGTAANRSQINPKFGLIWDITDRTVLRLAGFRTMKRKLLTDQTVEPTQVAGFNQFFDDFNGADMRRYGVGLDHKFSATLFGGVEASERELIAPFGGFYTTAYTREHLYRAYLNWAPTATLALSLGYELSILGKYSYLDPVPYLSFGLAPKRQTHRLPFRVNYFHPDGFFAGLGVTYVDQNLEGTIFPYEGVKQGSRFVLVDLGVGYRLPKRLGIVRIDVRNVFDERFQYQGVSERSSINFERDSFYYWPERAITGQVTLAF